MHQNNRMQSLTLCIVDSLTCAAANTPVAVVNCKQTVCVINKILISQLIACQRQLSGYPDDYGVCTMTHNKAQAFAAAFIPVLIVPRKWQYHMQQKVGIC